MIFKRLATAFLSALLCAVLWSTSAEAARLFNGTSDDLQSAATINLSSYNKLSLSYWLWVDSYATNNDREVLETSAAYLSNSGALQIVCCDSGLGKYQFSYWTTANGQSSGGATKPSSAAWHHFVHTVDLSVNPNPVVTYIDGVSQTITYYQQGILTTEVFGNFTLNVMARNNASAFLAGRMAELAIWGGKLVGQTDVTALNAGTQFPDDQTLVAGAANFYWKICGATSPELPTLGGINLNLNGTTDTPHPSAVSRSCRGRLVGKAQ